MEPPQTFRNKTRAINPRFAYLAPQDRHVLSLGQPRHRFNVIGCGINGQEHIRVTMLEGHATIHGIYDPHPGSVEGARREYAQFGRPDALVIYDSLEAACNDPAVDGLIIATPNYTHLAVLREAVKSGKHILLEKPMATTLPDAYEILRIARRYSAVLQVGLQYRYKPIYVEAIHEALVRRSIGEVKTITILEHREPFLDKVKQWNKFSAYSGGTLVEKCCHYFDLFNLFAQSQPVSVYAVGSQAVNFLDFEYEGQKADILDNAFVIVTYANGVRANFNLCMFAPMVYEEVILCGTRGRLKAFENEDFLPVPRPRSGLEVLLGQDQPSRIATPCYPELIEITGHNGGTYFEHVNFIERIEGRPTNAATAEDGFWSVVVGVAAEESVKVGAPVQIDDLLARHQIADV
jgi:myo-inositol 2-dehydrogenase/D-chiro-inositol 1-dehydrogenase